jgi:ATP-binding cassette, subfamily B, bacterial HlyB/CyaB
MSRAHTLDLSTNNAAREAVRVVLQTHVLFSVLPGSEKRRIEPLLEVRRYQPGEIIESQDSDTEGMHVIQAGRARLKQAEDGKVSSVGMLKPGDTIGEMSMLEQTVWPHDVVAEETVTTIFLPAGPMQQLLEDNTAIDEHFKRFVGLVQVGERLRGLLGKAKYSAQEFTAMLGELGVKRIRDGSDIFIQGDNDPRLYLIESGYVDLFRTPLEGDPISLGRLGRGALVGEGGALPRSGGAVMQPHTARAAGDVTVLVIYQGTVKRIIEFNPALGESLRLRARDLEKYEQEELAIRKRAEGVDLRIKLADAVTEEEFRAMGGEQKEVVQFKVVRQESEADNAAACLTMMMDHHGKSFPLNAIRAKTGLESTSVTIDQLIRCAEGLGFRSKGYALDFDQLKRLPAPCLIGLEGYRFAVLVRITDREVHVADPTKKSLTKLSKAEFIRIWTQANVAGVVDKRPDAGVVLSMEPTQRLEMGGQKKGNPINYFINYILPYKGYFGEAILAALVINLLGMASPMFVQSIVDTVVVHHDRSLLNMMLAGMVLVAVLTSAMTVLQSLLLAHTTTRLDMRIMSEFYRHVLSLPMGFFLSVNKGEILSRFGENQKIRAILTGSSITTVMNILMLTIYFMMMFTYNFKLTVIVIVFLPIFISIVTYFTPRLKKISQEIFVASTQAQSSLIESLNGIEAIKATSNEYFARARWENSFVENVNRGFQQQRLQLMNNSTFQLAILGMTTSVMWVGANQVIDGNMTVGELMGFNMLMGLVTNPVLQMVNLWSQLQEVRISVDRVAEFLDREPEHQIALVPAEIKPAVEKLEGLIEFKDVDFSYGVKDQTKYIMKKFNLTIQPGQRMAFVGPSGCGKSTIAKMVLGFNLPSAGEMLLDGKNILQLDLSSLRRNIGVVLQDSFIFSGSVAENIAFGDPEPDMQAVQEAARLAGAEEFIVNYPLGFQTPIGEKGMGISGGQRQRICIARAMYRRPRIMIFDEATSALDNESEERIIKQLEEKVMPGRTSISIAHRLTTIMNSDRICYIKDGVVQEDGNHQQLIDPDFLREKGYQGFYYGLARTQFDLPPLQL